MDERVKFTDIEYVGGPSTPSLVGEAEKYRVHAVRWPVLEGVDGEGAGESITLDLSSPARVTRLRLQPGYFKSPQIWAKNNRVARARIELSDGRRIEATFADEMREQAVAIGGGPVTSITVTIEEAYLGGDDLDTAISEIAVDTQ